MKVVVPCGKGVLGLQRAFRPIIWVRGVFSLAVAICGRFADGRDSYARPNVARSKARLLGSAVPGFSWPSNSSET